MKYDKIYKNNVNVWGSVPNKFLHRIYNQVDTGSKFLDLGCGQGRDSLFMLKKGFKVTAVDNSQEGIKKIKETVQTNNLPISNINLLCEDVRTFKIEKSKYSIINVFNSLQFLLKKDALKLIKKIKKSVKSRGYIIVSGFTVHDPFYKKMNNSCCFEPQELRKIYFPA